MSRQSSNLDILRAIAVLCVLTNHLLGRQPAGKMIGLIGQAGVAIFFVHTFLVLMLSLKSQESEPKWVFHFYIRRFFRIYPLPVILLVALFASSVPIQNISAFQVTPTPGLVARNLLLMQGFHESIIGPMWSLPFEVKMYIVLPLLFVVLRRGKGWFQRLLLVFFADIALGSTMPMFSDFCGVVPCFLGGALAYLIDTNPKFAWWMWPPCIICLCIAFTEFPQAGNLNFPAWGLCLAVGFLIPRFHECGSPEFARVAHAVAKYSYAIYLSHSLLIWYCLKEGHGGWWLFVPSMVLVPILLYHAVEEPMIRFGRRLTRANRASEFVLPDACIEPAQAQ